MKNSKLLFFCVLLYQGAMAQNLFVNPGFESGNTGWNLQINSGAATASYLSALARTGSNAAQVTITEAATANWHIQLNTPAWVADSGKQYRMSFYAKSSQNASIHVAVQAGSPSFAYITGVESGLLAGADWKKIEIVYIAGKSGSGAVNFNLYLGAAVTSYIFDDFLLEDITTVFPVAPTPPTVGAYYTDVYRNLFSELGKSQNQVNAKVNNAFQQLFHGDSASERLYYETGTDMAYILAPDAKDIRTEVLSYAMMICVQLNKRAEFDKIWKFTKTYV